ncbi:MAG: type II secretion system protein N [Rudaea sp.]
MRKVLFAAVALLAIVAIAVYTLPADVAYAWFGKRLQPATLSDLGGDVWNGHAGNLRVLGRDIGKLEWHLRAWPLLRGELQANAEVSGAGGSGSGALSQTADQTLDVRDAAISLPAATIEPALGVPSLHLRGTVEVSLAHARLRGIWVEALEGSAVWRDAAVFGAAQARLSDLRVDFATQADGTIGCSVRDLGGPLSAQGHCTFKAGAYDAEVRLAARAGDARVLDALQYVGQPQADGSVLLKIRGHLLNVF